MYHLPSDGRGSLSTYTSQTVKTPTITDMSAYMQQWAMGKVQHKINLQVYQQRQKKKKYIYIMVQSYFSEYNIVWPPKSQGGS
jgi:hypothetical protein